MVSDWRSEPWTIYDLETTGPDPETARVVQVALVRMHLGQVVLKKATLCNPGMPIPEEATAVHGITDAMVRDAPSDVSVMRSLAEWMASVPVIVTYNGMRYDDAIVGRLAGVDIDAAWANVARVDTLLVVRHDKIGRFWKGSGRHKLGAVAQTLNIDVDGSLHDATTDAVVTGRILWHLLTSEIYGGLIGELLPVDHTVSATLKGFSADQERNRQAYLRKLAKQVGGTDNAA